MNLIGESDDDGDENDEMTRDMKPATPWRSACARSFSGRSAGSRETMSGPKRGVPRSCPVGEGGETNSHSGSSLLSTVRRNAPEASTHDFCLRLFHELVNCSRKTVIRGSVPKSPAQRYGR